MHPDSQCLGLSYTAPADPHSHCQADSAIHHDACPEPRRERDERPDEGANAEPITASYLNTNSCPYPNFDTDPGRLFHCLCLRS
jgi:hypothetical protein